MHRLDTNSDYYQFWFNNKQNTLCNSWIVVNSDGIGIFEFFDTDHNRKVAKNLKTDLSVMAAGEYLGSLNKS